MRPLKVSWLWSPIYKGLEIAWRVDTARQNYVFVGWTTRKYKRRGW